MIEIDALLKDGHSALTDLQGSSPTGGLVASDSCVCTRIVPGDLIRHNGAWTVAARTRNDGIIGLAKITLIGSDGLISRPLLLSSHLSVEVRTDARIDPSTLRKLVLGWPRASRSLATGAASHAGLPDQAAERPARGSENECAALSARPPWRACRKHHRPAIRLPASPAGAAGSPPETWSATTAPGLWWPARTTTASTACAGSP